MNKIAIFDFCGTFVDFQTADAFVDFVITNIQIKNLKRLNMLNILLKIIKKIRILDYLSKFNFILRKRIQLLKLKGIDKRTLSELADLYISSKIKPHFIQKTVEQLLECKNKGYTVFFVSAAYDIYLEKVASFFKIDNLICSKIKFNSNDISLGKMDKDCIGTNKVKMLKKYLKNHFNNDYDIVYSITDSKNDIPILKIAKNKVVISYKKHQEWVDGGIKEIIYG